MPADLFSEVLPIAGHEGFFLRLFRCISVKEQSEVLVTILRILAMRVCLDPASRPFRQSDLEFELGMDLEERLLRACPLHWPGQQVVELDNTGDASAWLEDTLDDSVLETFCDSSSDDETVAEIGEEYLTTVREHAGRRSGLEL